ncbi:uncharacterized protein METZ01_LOCUS406260, partial [marine metagenome]
MAAAFSCFRRRLWHGRMLGSNGSNQNYRWIGKSAIRSIIDLRFKINEISAGALTPEPGLPGVCWYKMKQLALILACLISMDTLACRFNVRDVGFVDLGSEPYRLFIFVPDDTPTSEIELLESTAYATYLDSNVKATVLNSKDALKSKAARFIPKELKTIQAVLVSPDGSQSLPVNLAEEGKPLAVTAWDGLESVFDSKRRNSVLSKVYEHYGVILIVEGKNAEENQRIGNLANRVVKSISGQMDKLEKEIREPPVVE